MAPNEQRARPSGAGLRADVVLATQHRRSRTRGRQTARNDPRPRGIHQQERRSHRRCAHHGGRDARSRCAGRQRRHHPRQSPRRPRPLSPLSAAGHVQHRDRATTIARLRVATYEETLAVNVDDLILVSIDDHVVEPPDMFLNHVPAKYKAEAPVVVTNDKGVDQWMYQGRPQGVSGLNAVVSWPPEEWGRDPAGFAEMRPGVYDVHERVRDMNRNGILASMCFPTFTGFSARHLNQHREDVTLVMVSAYNDWHIDEWAGTYPDRFIPIAVLPTWNPEAMCAEIRRVAAKGCRAVTMPELPHLEGLPSYHDGDYWGPVFTTLSEENVVMCLHIGTGFGAISMAPNAPIDNLIILATQVSAMCAQDLLWGPAMRNYPDLKFAFSEGGIGWIPFYLDRSDRHYTNQKWLRRDFGDKLPSDVFREHSLACYVTDKTSLKLRHEIGIDIIAWECDYPHSDCFWPDAPEQVLAELTAAGADDGDIDKITWQNACRFFSWDPFARTPREGANVGALRAKGADVAVSIRPRKEWARLYAEKQLAKA